MKNNIGLHFHFISSRERNDIGLQNEHDWIQQSVSQFSAFNAFRELDL